MSKVMITIARGFGSGGKAIGVALAEQLGIPCYEKEILRMASDKSGINQTLFEKTDERLKGAFLKKMIGTVPRNYKVEPSDKKFTHDNNLYHIQCEIIEELAETQSCIIIGKCADYVLQNRKGLIRVFIDAPMNICVRSIQNRMGVGEEEAVRLINKTDRYRADYYRYYTGGREWRSPTNYDICLNSGSLGREKCVEILREMAQKKIVELEK